MRRLCAIALLGCWLATARTGEARAEPPANAAEPREYKATITSAIEEFEHDNFIEARELFERAHAMFPNARTLRGLGITAFELRNYVEAVALLEQALEADTKRLEGQLRNETQKLLERARKYVGEVRLKVSPASATIVVDGVSSERASRGTVVLGVGDHLLEFRAPGHLGERRTIRVKGEQTEMLVVRLSQLGEAKTLEVAAAQPEAAPLTNTSTDDRPPVYKRWWLWTTVGLVVVAGAAVGTTLWLKANAKVEHDPITTDNTPPGLKLQPLRLP